MVFICVFNYDKCELFLLYVYVYFIKIYNYNYLKLVFFGLFKKYVFFVGEVLVLFYGKYCNFSC